MNVTVFDIGEVAITLKQALAQDRIIFLGTHVETTSNAGNTKALLA
jgi:hypothetical protein